MARWEHGSVWTPRSAFPVTWQRGLWLPPGGDCGAENEGAPQTNPRRTDQTLQQWQTPVHFGPDGLRVWGVLNEQQHCFVLFLDKLWSSVSGTNLCCCVPRVRSLHHSLLAKWSSTLTTLMWSVPYSCALSCWRKVISPSFSIYWLFALVLLHVKT